MAALYRRKTLVSRVASGLSTKIGNARQLSLVEQLVQEVDDLLRPAEAERRDDDLPPTATASRMIAEQLALDVVGRRMNPVAVGRFGDQHVAALDRCGSTSSGMSRRPRSPVKTMRFTSARSRISISVMAEPRMCPASWNRTRKSGESSCHSLKLQRLKQFQQAVDILVVVERLDRRVSRLELAGEILRRLRAELRGVEEHELGDVGGRRRAEDRLAKAHAIQAGQVAAVIDVGVREDHRIELCGLAVKDFVLPPGLGAAP